MIEIPIGPGGCWSPVPNDVGKIDSIYVAAEVKVAVGALAVIWDTILVRIAIRLAHITDAIAIAICLIGVWIVGAVVDIILNAVSIRVTLNTKVIDAIAISICPCPVDLWRGRSHVAAEDRIRQRGVGSVQRVHTATRSRRRIRLEPTIRQPGGVGVQRHPASVIRRIGFERAIRQRGAATGVHPAARIRRRIGFE